MSETNQSETTNPTTSPSQTAPPRPSDVRHDEPPRRELPEAVRSELQSLRQDRASLQTELEQLRQQLGELPTLRQQMETLRLEADLARRGLTDPEGIDVARAFWQRLPQDSRPELPAWIDSLTPDTIPRGLAPYMPSATRSAPAEGAAPGASSGQPAPSATGLPQARPGTQPELTPPTASTPETALRAATERLAQLRAMRAPQAQIQQAVLEVQAALRARGR